MKIIAAKFIDLGRLRREPKHKEYGDNQSEKFYHGKSGGAGRLTGAKIKI
jgi:hypothetical protein